jgi:4-amino-4-deoxy-L-arabinose transferase-like glycosyltransferase
MPTNGSVNVASQLLLTPDEVAATSRTAPSKRRKHPSTDWERIVTTTPPPRVLPRRLLEILAVVVLVAIALALRTYRLTALPFGLHGDEATVGREALRILREGQIGPYSGEAMGQPTGPIYLAALAVRLLGNTILAVRIVPAILGTLTVLALYIVARRSFGITTALIATTLLATMTWHIYFARVGFPLEAWPLCVVLIAGAVIEAIRRKSWGWWATAGVLAGLGVYSYNAHTLFVAILGLFVALTSLQGLWRDGKRGFVPHLLGPLLMLVALVVAAWPLIDYVRHHQVDYFSHSRTISIFRSQAWAEQQTTADRARFLGERYRDFWYQACCSPVVDGADGSGVLPIAPAALLLLAVAGAITGLIRGARLVLLGSLVVLLIPWVAVFTVDGATRRSFAAAPFLALLAAMPLAWLVERGIARWRRVRGFRRVAPAALIAAPLVVLVLIGPWLASDYFRTLPLSAENDWVFAVEQVDAINYIRTLPADTYVYWFGERWPYEHETFIYLAPEYRGETRSLEFETRTDLTIDRADNAFVFIFIGGYARLLDEARSRYPQGTSFVSTYNNRPSFTAYYVGPSAAITTQP